MIKGWQAGLVLGTLSGLSLAWLWPMLIDGYPITHSTQFNLSWAFQYQQQFLAGQFYPRWLESSNFGFGNATFAFYPPLCMVATLPFRLLGWDLPGSLVASMGLMLFVFGLGLYQGCCQLLPWGWSLLIAAVGMSGSYFLGDIFIRGAIGEGWAVAIMPWILGFTLRFGQRGRLTDLLGLTISYGLLVLSHLPTLLIFTLVWLPLPWLVSGRWQRVKLYGAFAYALLWTGFYLWPAVMDQRFVQIDGVNFADEYKPQFRLMISGLGHFQPHLADHWFDSTLLPFWWLGVASVLLGWIVLAGMGGSPLLGVWLLTSTVPMLFMTDLLGWLYVWAVTLQRIQFSWRWMGITTVTVPLLWAALLSGILPAFVHWGSLVRRQQIKVVILACSLVVIVCLWLGDSLFLSRRVGYNPVLVQTFTKAVMAKRFPIEPQGSPRQNILYWHWLMPDGLALVDVPEYRARGASLGMPPPRSYSLVEWIGREAGSLVIQRWQYGLREFQANNLQPVPVALQLRTFTYPAWQIEMDGLRIAREQTAEGLLKITIPPGSHQLRVIYGTTLWESLGRWGTLVSGIGALFGFMTRFQLQNNPQPYNP